MAKQTKKIELTTSNYAEALEALKEQLGTLELIQNPSDQDKKRIKNLKEMVEEIEANPLYTNQINELGYHIVYDKNYDYKIEQAQATPKEINKLNKMNFKYWKEKAKKEISFIKHDELKPIRENVIAEIKDLELGFVSATNSNIINKVIRKTSIEVREGEILALIGESGSGKTVISSTLFGITGDSARVLGGSINLFGQEVQNFSQRDWEKSKYRGRIVSGVFQNPQTTLNPTQKIKTQIMEGLLINGKAKNKKEALAMAKEYLVRTRIHNVDTVLESYPHELSGGMKQRVVIASIIACGPKIIIMDEPTTALDPSVQAEIVEIVRQLAIQYNVAIIFITHDLGVVASIADRIAIMYSGQVIEQGDAVDVLFNPKHPYTWGLLQSMPDLNRGRRLKTIRGSVPTSLNNIVGEAFAPRNDFAVGLDFLEEAPFFEVSPTHKVKSWLYDPQTEKFEIPTVIKERVSRFKEAKKASDEYTKDKQAKQKEALVKRAEEQKQKEEEAKQNHGFKKIAKAIPHKSDKKRY